MSCWLSMLMMLHAWWRRGASEWRHDVGLASLRHCRRAEYFCTAGRIHRFRKRKVLLRTRESRLWRISNDASRTVQLWSVTLLSWLLHFSGPGRAFGPDENVPYGCALQRDLFLLVGPVLSCRCDLEWGLSSVITLAVSSGKRNVTVWRPSVCPVGILTVTRQGAACDAASLQFGHDNKDDRHTCLFTWRHAGCKRITYEVFCI